MRMHALYSEYFCIRKTSNASTYHEVVFQKDSSFLVEVTL